MRGARSADTAIRQQSLETSQQLRTHWCTRFRTSVRRPHSRRQPATRRLRATIRKPRDEPSWVAWRLLTLETRMESCRKNRHLGSRRRVGIRSRRRPRRCGWSARCGRRRGRARDGAAGRRPARLRGRVGAQLGQAGRHRRRRAAGRTTAEAERIKELEQEVRELRRANEILKRRRLSSRRSSTATASDSRVHRRQQTRRRRVRGRAHLHDVLQVAPSTYYAAKSPAAVARGRCATR